MIIENAIRAHLVDQAGLTALVSTRIYYMTAPQTVTNPYVVFFKVSAVPEYSLTGHSGLTTARFQFDIYADTYYETKLIAAQLATAIQDKCNEVIGGSSGVNVSVQQENEQDLYEDCFHCIVEYFIQYNE
jgi:hypothetical protein